MPKIRGVKPDYWTDEDIVELSIPARLLFIGLWNFACDNGHLDDKPKQIKMRILPGDDVSVDKLLDELVSHDRIERDGGVITIPKFAHHQRPHSRWWSTCDLPNCAKPDGSTTVEKVPSKRSNNRGPTVDNEGPRRTTAVVDGDGDGDGELTRGGNDAPDEFDEFWGAYPRKVAKGQARRAWKAAIRKVDQPASLIAACQAFAARTSGAEEKFIPHASTWLNGERWADEPAATGLVADTDGRLVLPPLPKGYFEQ